ncbi:hypothetical protein pb186bvf_008327 [Paramecium bursaria]
MNTNKILFSQLIPNLFVINCQFQLFNNFQQLSIQTLGKRILKLLLYSKMIFKQGGK